MRELELLIYEKTMKMGDNTIPHHVAVEAHHITTYGDRRKSRRKEGSEETSEEKAFPG